jgi:SAM-dependent methyltransferase
LTQYLSDAGRYDGIDIVAHGIAWCSTHISARYPNFQFHLSDIYNKEYNPKGKIRAQDYSFPFADSTFDFVFLTSVFTHMLPDDVEHYVAEIARVLKSGGRCLATFFLLNQESRQLMATGQSVINFKHDCGVYHIASTRVPELSVAYDEAFALKLFGKYGLELYRPIYYGGWDGRHGGSPHLGQQDILVTYKATFSNPL